MVFAKTRCTNFAIVSVPSLRRILRIVWKVASSYLDQDGDISEEMIAELTQHLDECPPCDAFVQSLRATIEGLKDLPKETAPERLKEELRKLVNPK